jgi:beta-glucosidase
MHSKLKYRLQFKAFVSGLLACFISIASIGQSEVNIDQIISQMSIEEKVGQMTQINLEVVLKKENGSIIYPIEIDTAKLKEAILEYKVGSLLNNGRMAHSREEWVRVITAIQNVAAQTDAQIPVLYGIDAIHGANYSSGSTLFPHQLAQAATWNPRLVERIAEITAYETRSSMIPWVFSPIVDVGRQPLWSQFFETYGEDVLLTSTLGEAAVRGYQGTHLSADTSVAACVKHFLGYSNPFSGKDRTPVYLDERQLREIYLPPFQKAIDQGVRSLIVNSGELNGIPCHANDFLLNTLLRDELGFEGVILSDWGDIERLVTVHRVSENRRDAARIAINAGIDMSMVPNDFVFCENLVDLVRQKEISESRIDESVRRILQLKMDLGLFEDAKALPENAASRFGSEAHHQVAYQTAAEAITLLKNEGQTLPLSSAKKILVVGPAANSLAYLNGPWSRTWQGTDAMIEEEPVQTIFKAIQSQSKQTKYEVGCSSDSIVNLSSAILLAQESDAVVLCIGEKPSAEKPGDIHDLSISEAEEALAKALIATGKPIILVLVEGRPRIVSSFVDDCEAVLLAYQPGNAGGEAIADVLFGEVNPSGHLPFTYPRYVNDLLTYDHKKSEEVDKNYGGNGYNPQWEFGEGLSYTNFTYSDFKLSADTINNSSGITIEVVVTNTGDRSGRDVIQLYAADEVASITPPVKRLIGFDKVELEAGESISVSFQISAEELSFVNAQLKRVVEEGWFTFEIEGLKQRVFYTL